MKTLIRMRNRGFTLIELMVVVAIIGILSAVAIPNFRKYQAKSKTSEAKIMLAGIYSAMTSLYAEYDNYGSCLPYAGFTPEGTRYYAVGFTAASAANASVVANGGVGCISTGAWDTASDATFGWSATRQVNSQIINSAALFGSALALSGTTATVAAAEFTAGAGGYISQDNTANAGEADGWTINDDKNLVHSNEGY